MVKVLYQNQQHANGSLAFVLEISVKDEPRSCRPITQKSDEILEKIKQDWHISSHDIAYELNIHHQTVLNHLQKAGSEKKLDVWVHQELSV